MTGDSGGSVRRKYSCVVAPSMRDVLRQPLPPKSVFLWLEEGLRNPQDERIFLLCCMYFLQMRAVRRMSCPDGGDVRHATTTWTKTTSTVSGGDNHTLSYEQTRIVKFPEGQQFWERLTGGGGEECRRRKVLKLRGRSGERRHREVSMVHVQCEANFSLQQPPEYDSVLLLRQDDDDDEEDCYQSFGDGKKPPANNGKLARLRRSLVKLFRKDSGSKKVDVKSRHDVSVKRQYSNVLNLEPRVSLNYPGLFHQANRIMTEESDVLYKNEKFNTYEVSDVNVVRSRTVVSVLQQHKSSAALALTSSDAMESDIRAALEVLEDAYLSDPGPTPTSQPQPQPQQDVWKPLVLNNKSAPYSRFRDIPSPPPALDRHAIFMK